MNPDFKTDDWAVFKAKQTMKANEPFLLLINAECLAQLEVKNNRLWYGVQKAKIKVFSNEPPDNILEEGNDASGLLSDLPLAEKSDVDTGTDNITAPIGADQPEAQQGRLR